MSAYSIFFSYLNVWMSRRLCEVTLYRYLVDSGVFLQRTLIYHCLLHFLYERHERIEWLLDDRLARSLL